MKDHVFRKKSVERLSSPEQLNDYIRVSNPSVWMFLIAVILLLAGMCVWGIFGRLETTLSVAAVSENEKVVCYVKDSEIASVREGMTVRIRDNEYKVSSISSTPISVSDELDEYLLHVGGLQVGQWVYEVQLSGAIEEGIYPATIVTESIAPLSFVFN